MCLRSLRHALLRKPTANACLRGHCRWSAACRFKYSQEGARVGAAPASGLGTANDTSERGIRLAGGRREAGRKGLAVDRRVKLGTTD